MSKVKIPYEVVKTFAKVINNDLKILADKIANDYGLNKEDLYKLIPDNLTHIEIKTKLDTEFLDVQKITSKNELNKYSLSDLKQICKNNKLQITGNKEILINRIWELCEKDIEIMIDFNKYKSYKTSSKKSNSTSKYTKYKSNLSTYHIVDDN